MIPSNLYGITLSICFCGLFVGTRDLNPKPPKLLTYLIGEPGLVKPKPFKSLINPFEGIH